MTQNAVRLGPGGHHRTNPRRDPSLQHPTSQGDSKVNKTFKIALIGATVALMLPVAAQAQ
jgi:hypothetical protein